MVDSTDQSDNSANKMRKIILVGDPQVGKTALSCALTGRPFPKFYEPTPASEFMWVDSNSTNGNQGAGQVQRLCIWDCGFGGPDAAITLKGYFKSADVAVLVYDLSIADSFEGVKHWHAQIKDATDECPNCKFIIVGTRSDLPQEISQESVDSYAKAEGCTHLLVSSKTKAGIEILLEALTRLCIMPSPFRSYRQTIRYKIAVLGDKSSGKTSLIYRILNKPLHLVSPTIDVQRHEISTKLLLEHAGLDCSIELYEGSGEDSLLAPDKRQINAILENCHAIIILADNSNSDGLRKADRFLTLVSEVMGLSKATEIPMLLLGTKRDYNNSNSVSMLPISLTDLQTAASEQMGIICADSSITNDSHTQLMDYLRVMGTLAHTWKTNGSRIGMYGAEFLRFGILNSEKTLRFRQGGSMLTKPDGTSPTSADILRPRRPSENGVSQFQSLYSEVQQKLDAKSSNTNVTSGSNGTAAPTVPPPTTITSSVFGTNSGTNSYSNGIYTNNNNVNNNSNLNQTIYSGVSAIVTNHQSQSQSNSNTGVPNMEQTMITPGTQSTVGPVTTSANVTGSSSDHNQNLIDPDAISISANYLNNNNNNDGQTQSLSSQAITTSNGPNSTIKMSFDIPRAVEARPAQSSSAKPATTVQTNQQSQIQQQSQSQSQSQTTNVNSKFIVQESSQIHSNNYGVTVNSNTVTGPQVAERSTSNSQSLGPLSNFGIRQYQVTSSSSNTNSYSLGTPNSMLTPNGGLTSYNNGTKTAGSGTYYHNNGTTNGQIQNQMNGQSQSNHLNQNQNQFENFQVQQQGIGGVSQFRPMQFVGMQANPPRPIGFGFFRN